MVADITNPKGSNTTIKHGSVVVSIPGTGYQTVDTDVSNLPTIATISGKYLTRWDDVVYYSVSGAYGV